MKRMLVSLLVVGYLFLAPFCFSGAALFPSAQAFDISDTSAMSGHVMAKDACTQCASVPNADADHTGMYLSVTSATGTPLLSLLLSLATLIFAFLFFTQYRVALPVPLPVPLDARKERRRLRAVTRQDILHWLALSETSPNFA